MAAKTSIATLAKELGVPSNTILAKIREAGEYVESTRAPLLIPVERLVRQLFPPAPAAAKSKSAKATRPKAPEPTPGPPPPTARELFIQSMQDPFSPLYRPPGASPQRREWYRGDPPQGLTLHLLRHYVTPQNPDPYYPPRRPTGAQFWDDEVIEARHLASVWLPGKFDASFSDDDILDWIRARVAVDDAIKLHNAGVRPGDMGFNYANVDNVTLADRLTYEGWSIDQVINEVSGRRDLGVPTS